MTHFVTDLTNLDFPKSDLTALAGGADVTKYVTAANWNTLCQAVIDLRGYALTGIVRTNAGNPNTIVTGAIGDILKDTTNGQLYINTSGGTVWTALARADGVIAQALTYDDIIGDSQALGFAYVPDGASLDVSKNPDASVSYNAYWALSNGVPYAWVAEQFTGALRTYANAGVNKWGMERTLWQTLQRYYAAAGTLPWLSKTALVSSTCAQWAPASSTIDAPTGKNLYQIWRDRQLAFIAASGRKMGSLISTLGAADGINITDTNNLTTNMVALCTQIRADFGQQVIFVWPRIHVAANISTIPNRNLAITKQIAAAAIIPNFILLDCDHMTQAADLLHWDGDSQYDLGPYVASAVVDLKGYPRLRVTAPAPDILGYGMGVHGNVGTLTPRAWGGTADGHTMYMFVCSAWNAGTPAAHATPATWTLVTNGSTAAISGVTMHYALFKKDVLQADLDANGGRRPTMPSITFAAGSVENWIQVATFASSTRFVGVDIAAPFTTAVNSVGPIPAVGVTTTRLNTRGVVWVATCTFGGGAFLNVLSATNPNLAAFAKYRDSPIQTSSTGDVNNTAIFTGTLAAIGPTGTTQISAVNSSIIVGITAALYTP